MFSAFLKFSNLVKEYSVQHPFLSSYYQCFDDKSVFAGLVMRLVGELHTEYKFISKNNTRDGFISYHNIEEEIILRMSWMMLCLMFSVQNRCDSRFSIRGHWTYIEELYAHLPVVLARPTKQQLVQSCLPKVYHYISMLEMMFNTKYMPVIHAKEYISSLFISGYVKEAKYCRKVLKQKAVRYGMEVEFI